MNTKSLFLGSTAALLFAGNAFAADAIVAPEPESVEYVRVCDAYGKGYFYIPGTETCLRIHGYVRYDVLGGDNVYTGAARDKWNNTARFHLRTSTASETELGTLKTYAEARFQWSDGKDASSTGSLRYAYIQLGGLRVGLDESAFVTFTGYLGSIINDDVILAGGYRTTQISYTYTGGNGFSAIIAAEQGGNSDSSVDVTIDDYTPHVVGGLKWKQDWGSIAGVVAYDARNETWAGKVRGDLKLSDQFSLWAQGGYKSNDDVYAGGKRLVTSFYGTWGGDWAVWGGAQFKATKQAVINAQVAYDDSKTFAASLNVAYELVPGFTITPEIGYTKWDDSKTTLKGKDAIGGIVRFQRSF